MKFYTQYERPEKKINYEVNSGEVIVEAQGYISAKDRIEALLDAGMRLKEYRKSQFDFQFDEEPDPDFVDPTRSPGYDLADASRDMQILDQKVKNAKMESDKNKKEAKNVKTNVEDNSNDVQPISNNVDSKNDN